MSRNANVAARRSAPDLEPSPPDDRQSAPRHLTAVENDQERRRRTRWFLARFLGIPFGIVVVMIIHRACS